MASWGEQFSTGDQGSNRTAFYEGGFKTCPQCSATKFTNEKHVAGCRHNGDGYGTEVYICQSCGWSTSFQYDEAGDSYFYEMKRYSAPAAPQARTYDPLTDKDKAHFRFSLGFIPQMRARDAMILRGFDPAEVDAFLKECASRVPDLAPPS